MCTRPCWPRSAHLLAGGRSRRSPRRSRREAPRTPSSRCRRTAPPSVHGFPLFNRQLHVTNGDQTGTSPAACDRRRHADLPARLTRDDDDDVPNPARPRIRSRHRTLVVRPPRQVGGLGVWRRSGRGIGGRVRRLVGITVERQPGRPFPRDAWRSPGGARSCPRRTSRRAAACGSPSWRSPGAAACSTFATSWSTPTAPPRCTTRRRPPAVIDEKTGLVVHELFMDHAHSGAFRAGETYFYLFDNPGNHLERGSKVTVLLGDAAVEHVVVH